MTNANTNAEDILKCMDEIEVTDVNYRSPYSVFGSVVVTMGFRNSLSNRLYVYILWKRKLHEQKKKSTSQQCSTTHDAEATIVDKPQTALLTDNSSEARFSQTGKNCEAMQGEDSEIIINLPVYEVTDETVNVGSEILNEVGVSSTICEHTGERSDVGQEVVSCSETEQNLHSPTSAGLDVHPHSESNGTNTTLRYQTESAVFENENNEWFSRTIEIPQSTWDDIRPRRVNSKLALTDAWKNFILDRVAEISNCVISFGYTRVSEASSRKRKSPHIKQHAKCTFANCCSFKFIVDKNQREESNIKLQLLTKGQECHPGNECRFRRTTSAERDEISSRLQYKNPEEVYDDLINEANDDKLLHGNFNIPKSPSVLRRIKSLISQQERIHRNVFIELDMMQRLYAECDTDSAVVRGFIQQRGANPFFVTMYSEQQIKLVGLQPHVFHLNATGSIFLSVAGLRKRMLLYSLILSNTVKGEPPVAVLEMVANQHDTETVSHMLLCFRMDFNRVMRRSVTTSFVGSLVVTDFSWVLIHAVLHEFNNAKDINTYLTETFQCMIEEKSWNPCTGVFLCANHVIHLVAQKATKLKSSRNVRQAFTHSFALLQYCESTHVALRSASSILILFGLPQKTPQVISARKYLEYGIGKWKINEECEKLLSNKMEFRLTHEDRMIEDSNFRKSFGIKKKSPWFTYFQSMFTNIKKYYVDHWSTKKLRTNKFYSPELCDYLLKHWLPLLPMWCMIVCQLFDVSGSKSWYTNADVENWFSFVKQRHLRKSGMGKRVRIGEFIAKQKNNIVKRLKRFMLLKNKGVPRATSCRKKYGSSMHSSFESWGRKRRARYVKPVSEVCHEVFNDSESSLSGTSSQCVEDDKNSGKISNTFSSIHGSVEVSNDEAGSFASLPASDSPATVSYSGFNVSPGAWSTVTTGNNGNTQHDLTRGNVSTENIDRQGVSNSDESGNGLIMILKTGQAILEYHMQSLLIEDNWLEQDIINAFLLCYNSNTFAALPDNDWNLIENGYQMDVLISRINWKTVENIAVGRHEPGHFVLFWIDVKKKKFSYINTIYNVHDWENKAALALNTWNAFVASQLSSIIGSKSFTLKKVKHPYQQDSNSCGVLVCMIGMCIAVERDLLTVRSDRRAIARHREFIWKVLCDNKDSSRCLACRQKEDPKNKSGGTDKWITCSSCGNLIHYSCADVSYDVETSVVDLIDWHCSFCRK
jgi:hypothetical protein